MTAVQDALGVAVRIVGLALLSGGLAAGLATLYRWYARQRVPAGLAVLVGLGGVALEINTTTALQRIVTQTGGLFTLQTAVFNVTAFLLAGSVAVGGLRAGDRIGRALLATTGRGAIEAELGRVVRTVGRVISVELPDEIDDIAGYDPVPEETREKLAGRSFAFPRGLTVTELEGRLVERLKADYDVGHVDVELTDDGSVEYLALGRRVAGIGPTLLQGSAAVAVRADPAYAASAGDLVQVWRPDPPERVLTGELRATAGEVVTLAVDADDADRLDGRTRYRLVTLPVESRPDREFVALLRAADETMGVVTLADGSPLAGVPVGALGVTVAAVKPPSGPLAVLPSRERVLAAGETLYVIARPDRLRRIEGAAGEGDPAASSAVPRAESPE